jgi:hypothetical protein
MTYQSALSVAATARAMGFQKVLLCREFRDWSVSYFWGLGNNLVREENREWRRRRLEYRGPRRLSNKEVSIER